MAASAAGSFSSSADPILLGSKSLIQIGESDVSQQLDRYWLRFWAQLQRREQDRQAIKEACQALEALAMQFFAHHGWRFSNRIAC